MWEDLASAVPRCVGLAHAPLIGVARAYIGTSGWVYAGWREHLYANTPTKKWLQVASRAFDALEINGSFYTQIKPETYARWYTETPDEFRFALKGHRFVTHYKRLRDCGDSIIRLRDQVAPLREKLAAVIWQLPSNFACREDGGLERLADFMHALKLWPAVKHALELRHRSWFTDAVAQVLREANVAVCMGDAPDFPMWKEVTSDLVYVRLHGHTRKYHSSYSEQSLRAWAADTKRWLAEGRDVHVYFDNDAEGHAVRNALRFQELVVGTGPREIPAAAWDQPSPERKPYPMASWGPPTKRAGSRLPARRAAARSAPAASGSAHAAPSPRPTAQPKSRGPSARRSTARTGSRARRPSSR
jgi:uncharacterized protein YecE (DUF72 family)